ncbi:hypothetical protein BH09VER1_BH09VER1_10080 [soil metagenome]
MGELKNERHEALAQLVAGGMMRSRACGVVYPKCNGVTAANFGARVSRRPEVAARIVELQGESAGRATMVLGQRLGFLREVAMTPYAEVDEGSVLCRAVVRGPHGVQYTMPDKLWALALYSKLAGDFEEGVVKPSYLGNLIGKIRANGGRLPPEPVAPKEPVVPVLRPGEAVLENGSHERWAQLVAGGERYARSYTQVYGTAGKSAEESAMALARAPEVRARMKYLQGQAAGWARWTVEHRMRYLQDFMRLTIGEIDEGSIYCQGVRLTRYGREVRVPSKLQAIELYGKLERAKAEDPEDGRAEFVEMMARIRRRRAEADRALGKGV